MNEREIFTAALAKGASLERDAYLEEACAGDPALRRRVEALLKQHEAAGSFLEKPPVACVADSDPPLPDGALAAAVSSLPRVHLREPPTEPPTPVVRPGSSEMPDEAFPLSERYQLVGEIARGGMGAVLKGRDTDLGRDIAVKVLLEMHKGKPELLRRFVEEAQIGGQLQHPGVVPVYELGQLPDRRPYFTMKLVKGRTLAALLAERPDPGQDRPRFLGIFAQVCQTLAYAHARGVIHRDLKPSNVMVGSFGEVQVMDWGLAKVLAEGGTADEAKASRGLQPPEESPTTIGTAEKAGSRTHAGSVLGTPAYMAPEQARGEVDRLDERCDVFGLGAILCEILTGQPPYVGADSDQVWWRASRAELADALTRLDGCGADAELIALAKRCLALAAGDRPRDAGVVATEVTAYQHSVAERLRRAERERAAAEARAEEEKKTRQMADAKTASERKRRRVQLALMGTLLALAVMGSGGAAWWWQQRSSAVRDVEMALAEAAGHRDAGRWPKVREAAERAEGRLGGFGPAALRARVQQARADANLVAELDEIRLRQADVREGKFQIGRVGPLYAEAFRRHDLDVMALEVGEAAARVRGSAIREHLLAALDNWAQPKPAADPERTKLRDVANGADDSDWRRAFRNAAGRESADKLKELAEMPEAQDQPPTVLALVGRALAEAGLAGDAAPFLRRAQQRHPGDFWVNLNLAYTLAIMKPPRMEEAVGYYRAALALRPDNPLLHVNLGVALAQEDLGAAIACYRKALDLDPNLLMAHANLGTDLREYGDVDGAIAHCRKALDLGSNSALVHSNLGAALGEKGDVDGAIAHCRKALDLDPNYAAAHNNLGLALKAKGDMEGTIACYRQAIALDSNYAVAYQNLGLALEKKGDPDGAITAFRRAAALAPTFAQAHNHLAFALRARGDVDGAIAASHRAVAAAREAVRRNPNHAEAHRHLGNALQGQGQLDEAIAAYRKSLERKPGSAPVLNDLGGALWEKQSFEEAAATLQQAIKHDPKFAIAHYHLGNVYRSQQKPNDAVEVYQSAIRLDETNATFHYNLGKAFEDLRRPEEAIASYRKALQYRPGHASTHFNLGLLLRGQGKLDEALHCFEEAVRLQPHHVQAHGALGSVLVSKQRVDEAVAHCREAVRLAPADSHAHYSLGWVLQAKGDPEGAAAAYRQAIVLKPDHAQAYCNLSQMLQAQGRYIEALAAVRRGHELGSQQPDWRFPSERWVQEAERWVEREVKLVTVLGGKANPASADEAIELALVATRKKRHVAAARLHADAFAAKPELAKDWRTPRRYSAACCAALAGCGRGEDATRLSDEERGRWRQQALDWLRADLVQLAKDVEGGKPQDRTTAAAILPHWLRDADLACVRDDAALAELPEAEREAWQRFWKDVQALLARLTEKAGKIP